MTRQTLARIAELEAALAKAEEALESCIYTRECEDMAEEEWCPSCGDILAATNMKRERRIYSHADGCRLESALADIKATRPSSPQGCAATDQREGV